MARREMHEAGAGRARLAAVALGGAAAVRDTLDFFERQLPRWFEEVAALVPDPFPSMPLAELRAHHDGRWIR